MLATNSGPPANDDSFPPAYFYTQPGATGPGFYDNMGPQSWQVRCQSRGEGVGCVVVSVLSEGEDAQGEERREAGGKRERESRSGAGRQTLTERERWCPNKKTEEGEGEAARAGL
eukprot:2040394-Rhodomonas_salina.2